MDLKKRLKFEKEIYFLKYLFKKPLFLFGTSFSIFKNVSTYLWIELIFLLYLLLRNPLNYVLMTFTITIDKAVISMFVLIAITAVYKAYSTQHFQEDYRKEKEERIKYGDSQT